MTSGVDWNEHEWCNGPSSPPGPTPASSPPSPPPPSIAPPHRRPRGPPSPPPSLQPLVFTAVEFPLYRLSPPASPVRSRSAPGRQRTASSCTPERAASARTHSGRRDSNHGPRALLISHCHRRLRAPRHGRPLPHPRHPSKAHPKAPPGRQCGTHLVARPPLQSGSRAPSQIPASQLPLAHTSHAVHTLPTLSSNPASTRQAHSITCDTPAPTHPRAPSACDSACDDNVIAASLSFAAPGPAHLPSSLPAAPLLSSSHSAQNIIPEMVHSRSYSAQDARVSTPATPTTATATTTPAPSSARQRTAPSSWAPPIAQGYSASEDGHASASPETRVGVSRNRSFGALARTWRRLSTPHRSSPERTTTRDTDKRAPLIDDATPTRQGSSHEASRMVQSLDGGRPDMHMVRLPTPVGSAVRPR